MNNLNIEDALQFALAGNAVIIFDNAHLNKQARYRFWKNDKVQFDQWYVYRLPEKLYLGKIERASINPEELIFMSGKAAEEKNYNELKVFSAMWKRILAGKIEDWVHVYHDGNCGVCGRPLVESQSVKTGIGPTCMKRLLQS